MPNNVPVYVINLPESIDRRAAMERQTREQGVSVNYFSAIDGRDASHPLFRHVDEPRRIKLKGRPFKPGELGAWASHYRLWETCIELDCPIVVLEDDAILCPEFTDFLAKADALARQAPYCRLYSADLPGKTAQSVEGYTIYRYWRSPLGAVGYLLTPDAARRFLQKADRWVLPVDDYMDLSWLHGVDCLGLKPGVVAVGTEFATTIQFKTPKERPPLMQKFTREVFRAYLRIRYCLDFIKRLPG